MRKTILSFILIVPLIGVPLLIGCDRTISEKQRTTVSPNGNTTTTEQKTVEHPDGSVTTESQKKTSSPNPNP